MVWNDKKVYFNNNSNIQNNSYEDIPTTNDAIHIKFMTKNYISDTEIMAVTHLIKFMWDSIHTPLFCSSLIWNFIALARGVFFIIGCLDDNWNSSVFNCLVKQIQNIIMW